MCLESVVIVSHLFCVKTSSRGLCHVSSLPLLVCHLGTTHNYFYTFLMDIYSSHVCRRLFFTQTNVCSSKGFVVTVNYASTQVSL